MSGDIGECSARRAIKHNYEREENGGERNGGNDHKIQNMNRK